MEAHALPRRRSLPRRRVLISAAALIAVALIAGVLAVFLWLRGYQTLRQQNGYGSNPGDGVMVRSPFGSGGTEVFFPRYRENGTFRLSALIYNPGRFTVTILGLANPDPDELNSFQPFRLVAAEVPQPTRPSYHGSPLDAGHPIRVRPGDEPNVILVYKFTSRCNGGQPPRYWTESGPWTAVSANPPVRLRVKYARWFEKTQNVTLPFAITLVCRTSITAPGVPG